MSNENNTPTIRTYVTLAVVAGSAVFGAYQLGKLGVDWAKEGVRAIKDKNLTK